VSFRSCVCCLAIIACIIAGDIHAQKYPDRPVRFVVPFPPGGAPDANARALGKQLQALINQVIVVDNRSGADGTIGSNHVARALPNGYTFLLSGQTLLTNAVLTDTLPYDVFRDFAPVTQVAVSDGYVVVVHPNVRAANVNELIAASNNGEKELRYGSPGIGTSQNLSGELFNAMAGAKLVHIPYRGLGPAVNALLGGDELQVGFIPVAVVAPHITAGKLRLIGITAPARWKSMPEVPTIAESIPGFAFSGGWHGVFAPAKTPSAALAYMQAKIKQALTAPELREYLQASGYEPVGSSPEEFRKFLRADFDKWGDIIRVAKIGRK
jgi:tripartite-type tricarboxylate transporter receptor subunit TctC